MEKEIVEAYFDPENSGALAAYTGFIKNNPQFKNKKLVQKVLSDLKTFTTHAPIRKNWIRRRVISSFPRDTLAVDLADYSSSYRHNSGMRFILIIVDIFSKYLWALPMRNKSGKETAETFRKFFQHKSNIGKKLWADFGKEFWNAEVKKVLNEHGIKLYRTYSKNKSVYAEIYVRILKNKISRYLTFTNKKRYVDVLPKIVKNINQSYNRSIGMPAASVNSVEAESKAWHYQFKNLIGKVQHKPKYEVGNLVKIAANKIIFSKGYEANFSKEIFKIAKVNKTIPVFTYTLHDLSNEEVRGSWYENELIKVTTANNKDSHDDGTLASSN